jgi:DNA polymerase type B, organellar and viral
MKILLNTIFKSLLKLNNKVNTFLTSMLNWTAGRVVSLNHVQHGRHSFKIVLNVILLQNDLKTLLYHTFIYLNQLEVYKNITHKTILVTITDGGGRVYSLHKSILVKPNFNLEEYYVIVNRGLDKILESGSGIDVPEIKYIEILVIDQDKVVNSKLKSPTQRRYYSTITPFKSKLKAWSPITTMDIETVEHKGIQLPVIVTLAHGKFDNYTCKSFIIKNNIKLEVAIRQLWGEVFSYIINERSIKTIFVHNLGGFDGIFIYKYLIKWFSKDCISSTIDNDNKFITINLNLENRSITWLDSYRIFPVSLNDLCKVFEVEGKLSSYSEEYNNLNIFYGNKTLLLQFINYAKQDSICLFNALMNAQSHYLNNYSVDIVNVVSTSNLSLVIFRYHFLKVNIPILKSNVDQFIRTSYFGGATDYYKAYGENLKYYDVNSLYPFVMKNSIPFEIIKYHHEMNNILLDSMFGFFLAEITPPETIKHPLLPYKYNGETIYPVGQFKGVYFSEELKNAEKYGYKINLLSGYECSKTDLFNSYVDHFYKIKSTSTGPLKFISKLHLNTLYGVFGRRQDLIKTINIHPKDITQYASTHIIKSIIQVSDKMWTLLVHSNLNARKGSIPLQLKRLEG